MRDHMKGSIRLLGVVVCTWLSAVSGTAHGSQARNLISGAGDGGRILGLSGLFGSFYVDDAYNLFWNPAFISGSRNWAALEFDAQNPNAVSGLDTSGGAVSSVGRYQLGVFLNRPTFTSHGAGQPIDLVFGGEFNFKWGVALTRSMTNGPAEVSRLKAGVIVNQWEPFVHLTLDDTNGAVTETKTANTVVGTRYHYKDWTPYAAYRTTRATVAGVKAPHSTNTYGFGVGRTARAGISRWIGRQATGTRPPAPPSPPFCRSTCSLRRIRRAGSRCEQVSATTFLHEMPLPTPLRRSVQPFVLAKPRSMR